MLKLKKNFYNLNFFENFLFKMKKYLKYFNLSKNLKKSRYLITKVLEIFGYKIEIKKLNHLVFPVEASDEEKRIMKLVLKYKEGRKSKDPLTMVSVKQLWAAISAVKYVVKNNIDGDIVECGVWRGGCSIAMALVLKQLKSSKKIILYDTFEGMTAPQEIDKTVKNGAPAIDQYNDSMSKNHNNWCYASIEDVKQNFIKHKCIENVSFIKGDVLETLQNPINLPSSISLLRLDTDWYESTKKELDVLFPLLQSKGVLLIDDYGWWEGSKKAVDEYFSTADRVRPLLWQTDNIGRAAIKIS